jgi:hypothetical protein
MAPEGRSPLSDHLMPTTVEGQRSGFRTDANDLHEDDDSHESDDDPPVHRDAASIAPPSPRCAAMDSAPTTPIVVRDDHLVRCPRLVVFSACRGCSVDPGSSA